MIGDFQRDDFEWDDAVGWKLKRPLTEHIKPLLVRTSFVLDGSCWTCAQLAKGEVCPPHDPSPRCESGKRNHCTCDVCF